MSIRDSLLNANDTVVAQTAFGLLQGLDAHGVHPSSSVAALATTFLLMCEVFELDVRETLDTCDNIMHAKENGQEFTKEHFAAVREYIRGELTQ